METLTFFKNAKEIQQKNIDAANSYKVMNMIMGIGEIFHRDNPVTKWIDRDSEKRLNILSDYNCYGAICGDNTSDGFKPHSNSNPECIHLKGCAIQIDPSTRTINFIHENEFGTPKFNTNELIELKELIEANQYTFGVSNSFIVGA